MGKKKKIIRYLSVAILLSAAALFLLNFHLTKRLERYLKKELIQRTADATDGFYRLSFDDLSISFFKGELKMKGVRLQPDSAVFRSWTAKDSLPVTYVTADVGVIDFKGVNLVWRWNYKQLHFNSFEIKHSEIAVFNSYYSSRTEKKVRQAETKTLYEVISPYIDILSVQVLNLENASVSYTVENPVSPIVYRLANADFHAYGFYLDKYSSESGKLLYCNDFDFVANQPQRLLANNDFTLETDSMWLSTKDSVISISNIHLQPQGQLWKEMKQRPDSYLDALIKAVEVKGIAFRREKALNYLTAHSFRIKQPDISVYGFTDEYAASETAGQQEANRMNTDSLVRSLSLYEIISPVLHSVAIQVIGIEKAKMQYSFAVKGTTEVYKLANFDFQANDFRVDSLSEVKHGFWYSKDFAFEANDIDGMMAAHNHRFAIKRMVLNTGSGDFCIEKFRLRPLSTRSRNDYMSGSIDTLNIRGLRYDNGISAEKFKIDYPRFHYVRVPATRKKEAANKKPVDNRVDVEAILNPFLRYLSVREFRLNNAAIMFDDNCADEPVSYQLNHFNFFASDILVNKPTNKGSGLFFNYGNMGFSFSDFDNYLPGKEYKLSIRKGQYSTVKGILSLKDVRLMPQDSSWKKAPPTYFSIQAPDIYVTGLKHLPENLTKNLHLESFCVESPEIRVFRTNEAGMSLVLNRFEIDKISWDSTLLEVGTVNLLNPVAGICPGPSFPVVHRKDSFSVDIADMYDLLGNIAGKISLHRFNLKDAELNYAFRGNADTLEHQKLDTTNLVVENLVVDNEKRNFSLGDIRFSTRNLAFPLDNGFYTLKIGHVDLTKANLNVERLHLVSLYPKMEFAYLQPHHKDWFDVSVEKLNFSGIDFPAYFTDKILRIKEVRIGDAVLRNFKNQQIPVSRHIVPMVYSGLQKAPLKLDIARVGVTNLSVVYEELALKGTSPGKLFFTGMNGTFSGFTNIVSVPEQYIRLDANGKLMGKGYFTATWLLPVDSLNNRFVLNARMSDFDLTALNELITPLASAEIQSGRLNEFIFRTEASSKGATVDMLFLYDDLRAALLKEKDGQLVDKKFLTSLVNRVLKHDNPDKTGKEHNKPRHSTVTIIRDPYHSTFNYLWQILRPALVESVGVSKKKQDTAKGIMTFFTKVKNFFHGKKKSPSRKLSEVEEKEQISLDFEPVNK